MGLSMTRQSFVNSPAPRSRNNDQSNAMMTARTGTVRTGKNITCQTTFLDTRDL